MKIDPNNTQSRAGNQPQITAKAGPTMGPVPAIDVKWWPNTTPFEVGTKSSPSSIATVGALFYGLSLKIFRDSQRR